MGGVKREREKSVVLEDTKIHEVALQPKLLPTPALEAYKGWYLPLPYKEDWTFLYLLLPSHHTWHMVEWVGRKTRQWECGPESFLKLFFESSLKTQLFRC